MKDEATTTNLVSLTDTGLFAKARLLPALQDGFVLLAGEIDRRLPVAFFLESLRKRRLIADLRQMLAAGGVPAGSHGTALLKSCVIPHGRGRYLRNRPDAHIARYDVALLVQTPSVDSARRVAASVPFEALRRRLELETKNSYVMVGENIRRIDTVDHNSPGIFLINYFLAADEGQNLAVWEHTAGWFQEETGLDNSLLLRPVDQHGANYTIVNHCRWDRLVDIVPSLLFKPSFRRYVLRHFEANETAAMPILYKLA